MRIGAILPHLLVFGGVRRYIELGNAFIARGHEFILFTPDGKEADWLRFEGEVRSFSHLAGSKLDVAISGSPELTGELDRADARQRVFYLQLENVRGEESIVRSGRYRIMVNSSGLERRVRSRYGIDPIDGIGGVNPAIFHPIGRKRGKTLDILCYGRLSRPRKGARFVVRAARWMHRRGYDVRLHLFDTLNPGEEDPRIGFDPGMPCVYYLGIPQERMAEMYSAADVFVSAEHRAGWSNTAAEASACGLAVVCTRSGTLDFAEDGASALVIGGRSPRGIRKALQELYRDRDLVSRIGAEASRRMLAFTWDAVCARMERSFTEISGG
ncbi:MAG TPA: glycosyltransferase [Candidatus Eisenbacteria bacterium]|uniref:Glycosyltransferase n=1 Tax=Eiseniibacteriota bacterium TaxID=2212470 RepID=A0A7V2AW98_UNCEI|nr:glycosyltransferase [Candidatus Eisenbacteria bacterium]